MSKFTFCKCTRPSHLKQSGASAVLVAGMLCTAAATAVDLTDTVQLHGFASQAYVSTSANKYFGNSDKGSFDFRELGVNLSWQAQPYLQFAAQVGSRKAGGTDEARPRFDYALIDFTAVSGEGGRAGVRVGRYRIPLGFYNLTRDVANSRPSIFLPESIYADASRRLVLAMDGEQAYEEMRTAVGDVFLEYGVGKFILDDVDKQALTALPSSVWRVMYEHDGGLVRLALTGVDANVGVINPAFSHTALNLNLTMLSAQYNAEDWSLTGEYVPSAEANISGLVLSAAGLGLPPPIAITSPDLKQKGESYYLQGTYRIATNWEALLRYDAQYKDKNDKSGVTAANNPAINTTGAPVYSFFTKDLTAGIGWSVRPDTKIRAEWHHVNGTSWLSTRENPVAQNTKQYWDLFALQVSYNF